MSPIKKIISVLFILLLIFVAHTLISTGLFRTIEPLLDGKILKEIPLKGAEDIVISHTDSFALISATNRLVYPPKEAQTGGLYLINLKEDNYEPILLTGSFKSSFAPHGIDMYKKDSSYIVMAISHTLTEHSIEIFELQGTKLNHLKTLQDPSMVSPNDLVIINENEFYFTNDHGYTKGIGKFLEEYGGLAVSNVVYFDNGNYSEVANGIAYANGINFDKKRNLLYVASVRKFQVQVYSKATNGSLSFIENIPCGTGVDNIDLDQAGHLWIGAHPNLLRFTAYAKGNKPTSPSEIIKIDYRGKNDYSIKQIYLEEGNLMSGASVAAPFGNLIFAGNVMDDEFLILEYSN